MAAELEEAVMDADAGDAQHPHPDADEPLLEGRGRSDVFGGGHGGVGGGQGLAVDLAIRRPRQGCQADERRREHVSGQRALQPGAQRLRRQFARSDVCHQPPFAPSVLARDDHALPDAGLPHERRLDLSELDAETAHLDLVIDPPEKFEIAVGQVAHAIARAVQARSGLARERMGDESLGGELGSVEVATADALPADEQLAGQPYPDGSKPVVEDVNLRVFEGPADGNEVTRAVGQGLLLLPKRSWRYRSSTRTGRRC